MLSNWPSLIAVRESEGRLPNPTHTIPARPCACACVRLQQMLRACACAQMCKKMFIYVYIHMLMIMGALGVKVTLLNDFVFELVYF